MAGLRPAPVRALAMMGAPEPLRLFGDSLADRPPRGQKAPSRCCLEEVARAARMMQQAQRQLTTWILTARNEGCSWRQIGAATGISHQTLHRRFSSSRSSCRASVSELD